MLSLAAAWAFAGLILTWFQTKNAHWKYGSVISHHPADVVLVQNDVRDLNEVNHLLLGLGWWLGCLLGAEHVEVVVFFFEK